MAGVPGPVHLDLPRDVLNESVELPDVGRLIHGVVAAPAPETEAVAAAVRLLEKARRPVLLAGGGVLLVRGQGRDRRVGRWRLHERSAPELAFCAQIGDNERF